MDDFSVLPDMSDTDFPHLSDDAFFGGGAEKLIVGELPGDEPTVDVQALAGLLTSLRSPARAHELAGEADAVAAFASAKERALLKEKTLVKERGAVKERGNIRYLPRNFGPKVAAATAVALVAFTGVAAAAVTGTLPATVQSFVHARIGLGPAPATHAPMIGTVARATTAAGTAHATASASSPAPGVPTPGPSGSARGIGPSVGGASTAGLCRASSASNGSSASEHSQASRNLQAAAAAAGQTVEALCAPYASGSPTTSGQHGKPGGPHATSSKHGHKPQAAPAKGQRKA